MQGYNCNDLRNDPHYPERRFVEWHSRFRDSNHHPYLSVRQNFDEYATRCILNIKQKVTFRLMCEWLINDGPAKGLFFPRPTGNLLRYYQFSDEFEEYFQKQIMPKDYRNFRRMHERMRERSHAGPLHFKERQFLHDIEETKVTSSLPLSAWPKLLERAWKQKYCKPDQGTAAVHYLLWSAPAVTDWILSTSARIDGSKQNH